MSDGERGLSVFTQELMLGRDQNLSPIGLCAKLGPKFHRGQQVKPSRCVDSAILDVPRQRCWGQSCNHQNTRVGLFVCGQSVKLWSSTGGYGEASGVRSIALNTHLQRTQRAILVTSISHLTAIKIHSQARRRLAWDA